MKASIANNMDYIANSLKLDENKIWRLIDESFQTPKDLTSTVDHFIIHLSPNHNIPGKDFDQMLSISQWVQDKNVMTLKQKRLIGLLLGSYWNEQLPF